MNLMRNWIGSSSSSQIRQKVQILKNNWDWLSARECDVRTELENAEIQPGKKRRREVDVWLRHVALKRTEVESISSEVEGQEFSLSRSELNGRIERVSEEIKDLLHHGTFLNGLTLDDFRGKSVPLVLTDLAGERFKVNVDRILWWLRSHEAFVIGVYGMGGVGKTTLLMNIHNNLLSNSTIFGHVYWVTVSQECSLYRLQHKIAEVVGIDLSVETDEKKRAAILRGRLAILGSTLLFLDDMWRHFLIDEVGIPLGADTCKIILTSRSLEVCRRMGCKESIIKVDTLPENEARKLFIDRVESYERLSTNVKQIAERVIDGCGGLPLAIITVACSMRGVFEIHEWQNALVEIQKASNWHDDMDNNILVKLKVSYDRLNDRNLQLCFLSCVLFPEDYPIWRETLIELWIMEGLLDDVESRNDQVNKGHSIINKLENVCLLQSVVGSESSDSDYCVRMHDLIRDMAIFITRDSPRFIVKAGMHLEEVPGEENWTEDLVKVSLMGNKIQEIPCQMSPRCSNLSVLFLQNNPLKKIPHTFFMHMTSLTLLDLSATGIETLPDSVSDLESLRLLMLRFCAELVYVPSLSKLTKLKVLNLYGTKIDEAPMGIEDLSHLEEISCGWKPSHLDAFNRYIECQHFQQLRYYGFWLREPGEDFQGSRISNKEVVISGHVFKEGALNPLLPYDIQYLQIDDCDITAGASSGSAIPSLYDAMELKNLHIRECKGLEYISSHSQSISLPYILTPLRTVEYLELFGLCDLRGLIKVGGEAPPSGTFSHLKTFIIENCSRIKKLFPINVVKQQQSLLPFLEYIKVSGCEEMEEIFTETCDPSFSDVRETINPTNAIISLPSVRILKLLDLPNLKSICCGPLLCTSLQNFYKEECPKLNLVPLTGPFLCDSLPSSLSSLRNNEQSWQWLKQHYPHDARRLQSYMDIQQTESCQA